MGAGLKEILALSICLTNIKAQQFQQCSIAPNTNCHYLGKVWRFAYDSTHGTCRQMAVCKSDVPSSTFRSFRECSSACGAHSVNPNAQCGPTKPCAYCQRCVLGQCIHNPSPNCSGPRDPCTLVRCKQCHQCSTNSKNQARCVYQENCCPPGILHARCSNNPCATMSTDCPNAASCVNISCRQCGRKFYDADFNELSGPHCTAANNTSGVCSNVDCGPCRICHPENVQCIRAPCHSNQYTCVRDPSPLCNNASRASCATVRCRQGTVCRIVGNRAICVQNTSTSVPSRCLLSSEPGPCRNYSHRYFYNPQSGRCEQFIYGGCRGNANNFPTQASCGKICTSSQDPRCAYVNCHQGTFCRVIQGSPICLSTNEDEITISPTQPATTTTEISLHICQLPHDPGPCQAYIPSFYYDSKTKECKSFIYGGCAGNENRFQTKESCQSSCRKHEDSIKSHCLLPKEPGPCFAHIASYYYNSAAGHCQQFIYGGCEGNNNRFSTIEECRNTCKTNAPDRSSEENACKLPKDPGPCFGFFPKFYYDYEAAQCKAFVYGGCQGNDNRFDSISDCENACKDDNNHSHGEECLLPKDSGPCTAYIPSFYYDRTSHSCKSFIYGGCQGNRNRFSTKDECENACIVDDSGEEEACYQLKDQGPCQSYIPSFYYDIATRKCTSFTYGGCQGNKNRFSTKQQCELTCIQDDSREKTSCQQPKDPGPCTAHIPSFYYDISSQTCQSFVYGGCGGNENRFSTILECETTCVRDNNRKRDSCHLPKDSGPCEAYIPSFYYDNVSRTCQSFIYGGCQGNDNRFSALQECENTCLKDEGGQKESCHLPRDPGPCRAYIPSFYYDSLTRTCESFIYGGCQGNKNRFSTKEECESTCFKDDSKETDLCHQPKDPGPCRAYIPSFYYDSLTRTCESFIYGGCQGNDNRFSTKLECQDTCMSEDSREKEDSCHQPQDPGPCRRYVPSFYYDTATQSCQSFIYGGCQGNKNRFSTKAECESTCIKDDSREADLCHQPQDPGPCQRYVPSFYYDAATQSCQSFIYGGCQGNKNRFSTKAECESKCIKDDSREADLCHQPKDPGPCQGYVPSFYYDKLLKSCKSFIYGGCQGNDNRFNTMQKCDQMCKQTESNICDLPMESGPCNAYIPSYYYDSTSQTCKNFIYGGCQGNDNRFESKQECENTCKRTSGDACGLPKDPGPCRGNIPQYYFDRATKMCQFFTYGGCQGNANRFSSHEECANACLKDNDDICQLPRDSGPCRGHIPQYNYNGHRGMCEQFIYGGCQGNKNRFLTKRECERACQKKTDNVCNLPMDPGPCTASLQRYYYDSNIRACRSFIYGGCLGNDNRFERQEQCHLACSFKAKEQHSGICPPVTQARVTNCTVECFSDTECPSGYKCCSNGCGRSCIKPER